MFLLGLGWKFVSTTSAFVTPTNNSISPLYLFYNFGTL
jgi:hypothetical protein